MPTLDFPAATAHFEPDAIVNRSECLYTPRYCEENVFHLAAHAELYGDEPQVVFLSNRDSSVAMLSQSERPAGVVIWDYHTILVTRSDQWLVWDLDSILPFPCDARRYVVASLPFDVPQQYRPLLRVIDAAEYRAGFFSDRRHMRNEHGSFQAPPPSWPAIRGSEGSNLHHYIDMDETGPGRVLTVTEFLHTFAQPHR